MTPEEKKIPRVKLGPDLHRVVLECEPYFALHPKIYQRGGKLVDVAINRIGKSVSYAIREMPVAMVRLRLSEVARLQSFSKSENKWKRVPPPDPITNGLSTYGRWPNVRTLVGIRQTPFLRPDGTICSTSGYDQETGYALAPTVECPEIPEHPTQGDAVEAARDLLDIVCDFPFANDAGRSAWLAMLLTMIARPAIEGSIPAFGVSATVRGSGKGRLIDCAANILLGKDANKNPFPENDIELRKTLTSLFLRGSPIILFDNIDRVVHGASIENAITATEWGDRELGKSVTVEVQNDSLICFTGNNLVYGGDTARRVIPIEIDARIERPENRKGFRHGNLLGYVRKRRGEFVAAALTILRAYYAAGRPLQGIDNMGSFEAWSELIPHCLVWAGLPNPLNACAEQDDVDDSTAGLTLLFDVWQRIDPQGEGMSVKSFLDKINDKWKSGDPVSEAAKQAAQEVVGNQKVTPQSLGQRLRTLRRRIMGGRFFDYEGKHHHYAVWKVHSE